MKLGMGADLYIIFISFGNNLGDEELISNDFEFYYLFAVFIDSALLIFVALMRRNKKKSRKILSGLLVK